MGKPGRIGRAPDCGAGGVSSSTSPAAFAPPEPVDVSVACPPCAGRPVAGDSLGITAPSLGVAPGLDLGLAEGRTPGKPVIGFDPERSGRMSTTAINNPTTPKPAANRAVRFRPSIAFPPPVAPSKPYNNCTLLRYIDGIK